MFVFDTINTCVNIAYDFCVGAYLQLQWIANMQRQSGYARLFCWSRSLTAFVAQDEGHLIIQQYMYSNFQLDEIFVLKHFHGNAQKFIYMNI